MADKLPQIIEAPYSNPYDLELDISFYFFVIAPRFDIGRIEVEVHKRGGEIEAIIQGSRCQDIYNEIFRHKEWVTTFDHAAYLGKELKKAEIALALGMKDYYQE